MEIGNKHTRRQDDFYETPAWCVRRLLERVKFYGLRREGSTWLEPAAGHGAIIKAVNDYYSLPVEWTAVDIRREARDHLKDIVLGPDVFTGTDFLQGDFGGCEWDAAITNPPYSHAMEFIEATLPLAGYVAMLLRLNFLGSSRRAAFFANEMPDVYVLPNRPSFTGKGTDRTEYAWAVWTPERGRKTGRVEVLADTPPGERR